MEQCLLRPSLLLPDHWTVSMKLMPKALRALLIVALAMGTIVVATAVYARRDNAYRVARAQQIVNKLERFEIGKSNHSFADAIVAQMKSLAPLRWKGSVRLT
jgi:hypothetical protein